MGGDSQCHMTCPAFYHLPDWCTSEPWNCHCMLMSEMQKWMRLGERREGTLCLSHVCFGSVDVWGTFVLPLEVQKTLIIWTNAWKHQMIMHNCHHHVLSELLQQSIWHGWDAGRLSVVMPPSASVCFCLPNQGLELCSPSTLHLST